MAPAPDCPLQRLCFYHNCGPVSRMRDCPVLQKDIGANFIQLDASSHVVTTDGLKVPFKAAFIREWVRDHFLKQARGIDAPVETMGAHDREIAGFDSAWSAPDFP